MNCALAEFIRLVYHKDGEVHENRKSCAGPWWTICWEKSCYSQGTVLTLLVSTCDCTSRDVTVLAPSAVSTAHVPGLVADDAPGGKPARWQCYRRRRQTSASKAIPTH